MSPKELLYIEDALGHTQYLMTQCRTAASQLTDPVLRQQAQQLLLRSAGARELRTVRIGGEKARPAGCGSIRRDRPSRGRGGIRRSGISRVSGRVRCAGGWGLVWIRIHGESPFHSGFTAIGTAPDGALCSFYHKLTGA